MHTGHSNDDIEVTVRVSTLSGNEDLILKFLMALISRENYLQTSRRCCLSLFGQKQYGPNRNLTTVNIKI